MPPSDDYPLIRRRLIIDFALRRAKPGSGSERDFLVSRSWRAVALEWLEVDTRFVIVGAVATALYMPRRATMDLDVLVLPEDARAFHGALRRSGYALRGPLAFGGTTWVAPGGRVLDVLESDEPWARAAVEQPNLSPAGEPVIGLPYLVLMKLAASRPQDVADASRMLGAADEAALNQVREVVQRYRPMDAEDLESLVHLGRLEFKAPE